MASSPFRGGMPKNYDSGGSSSETENGICLTLMEKKLRSTAAKTKTKVFGTCSFCGQPITGEKQRVEIAIPTTINSGKFVLSYDGHGVAKLHSSCWKNVLGSIKQRGGRRYVRTSRNSKTSNSADKAVTEQPKFESVERSILKEVSGAAEFYDPMVVVGWEAIRIARLIKSARHCIVFTGAGISTAAGIGDFRGKAGKWTSNDLNDFISDLSLTKKEDPTIPDVGVDYETLRPTYTHEALKILLDQGFVKYIISQNGDGLHKLSGVPTGSISELHGNVFEEYCEKCGTRYARDFYTLDDVAGQYFDDMEDYGKSDIKLPKYAVRCKSCGLCHRTSRRCSKCKGYLLDTIINFGDNLEQDIMDRAEEHAGKADLVISLGTTMAVTPANSLVTRNKGAGLLICNRQKTEFDSICDRKNGEGARTGSRVYIDCDVLMKCVMSLLLNTNDLIRWEGERDLRLKIYDTQRHKPDPISPTTSTNVSSNQASSSKPSGSNKTANYKVRGGREKKMSDSKDEEISQEGGLVGKRAISPEGGKQKRRSSKRIKIKL